MNYKLPDWISTFNYLPYILLVLFFIKIIFIWKKIPGTLSNLIKVYPNLEIQKDKIEIYLIYICLVLILLSKFALFFRYYKYYNGIIEYYQYSIIISNILVFLLISGCIIDLFLMLINLYCIIKIESIFSKKFLLHFISVVIILFVICLLSGLINLSDTILVFLSLFYLIIDIDYFYFLFSYTYDFLYTALYFFKEVSNSNYFKVNSFLLHSSIDNMDNKKNYLFNFKDHIILLTKSNKESKFLLNNNSSNTWDINDLFGLKRYNGDKCYKYLLTPKYRVYFSNNILYKFTLSSIKYEKYGVYWDDTITYVKEFDPPLILTNLSNFCLPNINQKHGISDIVLDKYNLPAVFRDRMDNDSIIELTGTLYWNTPLCISPDFTKIAYLDNSILLNSTYYNWLRFHIFNSDISHFNLNQIFNSFYQWKLNRSYDLDNLDYYLHSDDDNLVNNKVLNFNNREFLISYINQNNYLYWKVRCLYQSIITNYYISNPKYIPDSFISRLIQGSKDIGPICNNIFSFIDTLYKHYDNEMNYIMIEINKISLRFSNNNISQEEHDYHIYCCINRIENIQQEYVNKLVSILFIFYKNKMINSFYFDFYLRDIFEPLLDIQSKKNVYEKYLRDI